MYVALCPPAVLSLTTPLSIYEQGEAVKVGMRCPHCGNRVYTYRNPFPAVDLIIELEDKGMVLVQRAKRPYGWALPGGFVEYGEALEEAARREAREETSLDVKIVGQLGAYSAPDRDPRHPTISVVFLAALRPRAGQPQIATQCQESVLGLGHITTALTLPLAIAARA